LVAPNRPPVRHINRTESGEIYAVERKHRY
jgi:hypothetical protein